MFDAGDVFGIMRVEEEDEDEEDEDESERCKPNPGEEILSKVIVTRESGLCASDPNR